MSHGISRKPRERRSRGDWNWNLNRRKNLKPSCSEEKQIFRWAGAELDALPAGRDLQGPWRCSLLYADNARNVAAFGKSRKHQNAPERHDQDELPASGVTRSLCARYI
jgi:hypothetical protein